MKRTIKVLVGGEASWVGTLHYEAAGSRERAAFAYGDTWLHSASRFALEPALPLVAGPQFHRRVQNGSVFHGAFADTEPDGWAKRVILRDHAKRRQAARRAGQQPEAVQLQGIDFLLAVDDAGTGFIWPTALSGWEHQACNVAGRNLSRREWSQLIIGHTYAPVCP